MKPYITADAVRRLNQFNVDLIRNQIHAYREQARHADTALERAELMGGADALERIAQLLNLEDISLQQKLDFPGRQPGVRIITRLPTPEPQGVQS